MPPPKDPIRYAEWLKRNKESHTGKKLSPETRAKMSASRMGNTNSNGHVASEETRQKMSAAKKNVPKSEQHKQRIAKAHEGKHHTDETKSRIREKRLRPDFQESHSRENHHNWKGGITTLRKLIRESTEMYEWKKAVFERDEYKDWFSGVTGFVEAHHIVPFSVLIKRHNIQSLTDARACKELWDINNGITMITSTHKAYHDMWGSCR